MLQLCNLRSLKETPMMIKRILFATALLSLALAGGCAKGGSGPCVTNCPAVTVNDGAISYAGVGLSLPMTATVTGASQTAVNWTITGSSCTGSGNPCGTLTNVTTSSATYNAPTTLPSNTSIDVVATLQSDSSVSGSAPLTIIPDTSDVSPAQLSVGVGLTQQFTAVAVPDQAPQNFTWSCTAAGSNCVNFSWNQCASCSNGVASYTPVSAEECGNKCVQITATATIDPTGCSGGSCTMPNATVVNSRISGTYAFQFSGFDSSGKPVKAAGTFTADTSGTISSGVEDLLNASGPHTAIAITGGAYVPSSSDLPNSNNAGTLTLTSGVSPSQFQVVLDGAGDIQMIESDGNGTGSGVAELASKNQFSQGSNQAFAFGFTGVDSSGNRVGYAGLLPTNGAGAITAGLMDINDNGSTANICGTSPCNLSGSYTYNSSTNVGQMVLTSAVTMHFDFFVANGQTKGGNNAPLSIYAISTDPVDTTHPAVMGTITFQNSATYNNAAFSGTSVSALIGANNNVSLTLGATDGKSGGTGGTGGFTGTYDWNNAGTMVSVPTAEPCPGKTVCSFTYTYVATNGNVGRYVFQFLGNPNGSPVLAPLPFVLYATGANSGFLLDQSSQAVITGTMTQQTGPKQNKGTFANSSMTGTFALATSSNSVPTQASVTMNLLLTSPGNAVFNVAGTEDGNPANAVTGTYNVQDTGVGSITLTKPGTANYILYGVNGTQFYLIDNASKDSGAVSPILFMEQ